MHPITIVVRNPTFDIQIEYVNKTKLKNKLTFSRVVSGKDDPFLYDRKSFVILFYEPVIVFIIQL